MHFARFRSPVVALVLAAMLGIVSVVPGLAASSTVTVTPGSLSLTSWYFYDDVLDAPSTTQLANKYEFVSGPAAAGVGSVRFQTTGSERWNMATSMFGGTPLSAITALKFNTFQPSAGQGSDCASASSECAVYLNFDVDFGPGVCTGPPCTGSGGYQRRLVYVPAANGTVAFDTWQEWDALAPGALWNWSGFAANGGKWPDGDTTPNRTWAAIKTAFPNAHVNEDVGSSQLLFRAGEPYPNGFVGYFDKATIGVSGNNVTYNFEPTVGPPTSKDQCKNDGWKQFNTPTFKNQGDCVSYANNGK
jgi:hypothetical protein